eukprot:528684-Pelagomonas_calceolata.AAC.4
MHAAGPGLCSTFFSFLVFFPPEDSEQQHRNLCHHLTRASAQVTLHTALLGVDGVFCIPHTLETLKELGLDTHKATKLARKLHTHPETRGTASNPPDLH